MLHPSDLHTGWRTALRSLALSVMGPEPEDRPEPATPADHADDGDDAEREPFHLDDTELANRLVRDRGLIHYSTPPHARLVFPSMVQR